MEIVMTITESDSSGGVGIQADLKTFQEVGVFGTSAITAITAQNTLGVDGIHGVPADFVVQQMVAVFRDMPVCAVKTGMLPSAEIIKEVALILTGKDVQIVVDPVMVAKGGTTMLQNNVIETLKMNLLPLATVITPTVPQAALISGVEIHSEADVGRAARAILTYGVNCVLIKGSHLNQDKAIDTAYFADGSVLTVESPRIQAAQIYGAGCTFSAALTAFLAKGHALPEAIVEAKNFIHLAISQPLHTGNGHRLTNHFAYHLYNGQAEMEVNKKWTVSQ